MKKDEKQPQQPIPWEVADPKPPVIRSGKKVEELQYETR